MCAPSCLADGRVLPLVLGHDVLPADGRLVSFHGALARELHPQHDERPGASLPRAATGRKNGRSKREAGAQNATRGEVRDAMK